MHINRRRFIILSSAAVAAAPFRNVIAQTPPATRF
jgi:hypothetical protein